MKMAHAGNSMQEIIGHGRNSGSLQPTLARPTTRTQSRSDPGLAEGQSRPKGNNIATERKRMSLFPTAPALASLFVVTPVAHEFIEVREGSDFAATART